MDMHQNIEQLQESLDNILQNENFKKSARSVQLLSFLFEKAINGEDVNEVMLGEELFKSNYNYENSDSKVRVYMHYLRKKLDEYYHYNDAVDISIKFIVKKGQYNLSFFELKSSRPNSKPTTPTSSVKFNLIYIAFSLIIGLSFGILVSKQTFFKGDNYCWNTFFNSKSENLCVISEHLVFSHKHSSGTLASVHPEINTQEDFINYLQRNSETTFELADYVFLTKMAPMATKNLNSWFVRNGNDFSIRFEEDIEMDELHDKNFIFIGSYRIMGKFKNIFLSNSERFSIEEEHSDFSTSINGVRKEYRTQYPNYRNDDHKNKQLFTEYAMVSFMTLENGNKGLFFTSNHDIGVMATTSRFTDEIWLENFYESNNIGKDVSFNALFEVSGVERSEVSCKLADIELIVD